MVSIGSQFSTGEQRTDVKEAFWRTGFSICQNSSCTRASKDEKTISSEEFPANCRMNGDACGTTVFTCCECDWKTSFQWDDAAEVYYYETQNYEREPPSPKPPHLWGGVNVEEWLEEAKIDPRIRSKLRRFQISGPDMSELGLGQFNALGLQPEEAKAMVAAIENKKKQLQAKPLRSGAT